MERNVSDASTSSTAGKLRSFGSAIRRFGSGSGSSKRDRGPKLGSSFISNPSSPIDFNPPIQKFVQELDAVETVPRHPPTPTLDPTEPVRVENATFSELQAIVRAVKVETEVSSKLHGTESAYSVYAAVRDNVLKLCQDLVRQSQDHTVTDILVSTSARGLDSLWHRQSMRDSWYLTIRDFRAYLEELLADMHKSLVTTYRAYRPDATPQQTELLFREKSFRDAEIRWMRTPGISTPKSKSAPFWFEYEEAFRNYKRLQHDLDLVDNLLSTGRRGKDLEVKVKEYNIAPKGDTILEFQNYLSPQHPMLVFRVSSSILEAVSPYFSQILSWSFPDGEVLKHVPPAPIKRPDKDGTEINVYRMPQTELNKWESLTILLSAAHHQYDKVPKEVTYEEFVSIAEVCLRYQCTAPLEMFVEHRWLPQWIHKALDEPVGFLLISYCFGRHRLFRRCTKTAILTVIDYDDLQSKELWPQHVKDKINAVREAKKAQIFAACRAAIEEYFKPPPNSVKPGSGPFELTSSPRCPRGSRQCDATNLGWLMLLFNELEIMPQIMTTINGNRFQPTPRRSIQDLVEMVRRLPGTPQIHSGICDHAATLRNTMHDIWNSISGVTISEVGGRDGWAWSKDQDESNGLVNESGAEVFELPVPLSSTTPDPVAIDDEAITLRILSHLDNIEDLHAAAQIDKAFYAVYKKHELFLMKAIIKSNRRDSIRKSDMVTPYLQQRLSSTPLSQRPLSLGTDRLISPYRNRIAVFEPAKPLEQSDEADEDIFGPSTPHSPVISIDETTDGVNISWWSKHENLSEAEQNQHKSPEIPKPRLVLDIDYNSKFLPSDRYDGDKSLVVEGKKHLRNESDTYLRSGMGSGGSNSPA